jgi:hypothetical protein
MVFSGAIGSEETQNFTVCARLPQGHSCAATPRVSVAGHYQQGGLNYNLDPVTQIVIIEQFYDIYAYCKDGDELTCESGEIFSLKIFTCNTGNGEDNFLIDIENRVQLEDKGFKLSGPVENNMLEYEYKPATFLFDVPQHITGYHAVNILIVSLGSEDTDFVCKQRMMINLEIVENTTFTGMTSSNGESFRFDYLVLIFAVVLAGAASSIVVVSYRRERRAIRESPQSLPFGSHYRYSVYPEP